MKNKVVKILPFFLFVVTVAQGASFPKELLRVERKYKKSKGLSALFKQTIFVASLKKEKKSSGKILLKFPSKVFWETKSPEPSQLISNGKTFWFYTPPFSDDEAGQVVVQSAKKVRSQWASQLLSGSFKGMKNTEVQNLGEGKYQLTPKKGTSGDLVQATIQIKNDLIVGVDIKHRGGNLTHIELHTIRFGVKLLDSQFDFDRNMPKNTVHIQGA
tara:strand:- start:225 stop:869 length:645 start_codon:yes stop_codon:yes gene_type:complete